MHRALDNPPRPLTDDTLDAVVANGVTETATWTGCRNEYFRARVRSTSETVWMIEAMYRASRRAAARPRV